MYNALCKTVCYAFCSVALQKSVLFCSSVANIKATNPKESKCNPPGAYSSNIHSLFGQLEQPTNKVTNSIDKGNWARDTLWKLTQIHTIFIAGCSVNKTQWNKSLGAFWNTYANFVLHSVDMITIEGVSSHLYFAKVDKITLVVTILVVNFFIMRVILCRRDVLVRFREDWADLSYDRVRPHIRVWLIDSCQVNM